MNYEEILIKIENKVKGLAPKTIFTFDDLLDEFGVKDTNDKMRLTTILFKDLEEDIEAHPEEIGAYMGLNFVGRYIKK